MRFEPRCVRLGQVRPQHSARYPTRMRGLTDKQRRFIDSYLAHLNGARAAREAGYSPNCARVTASRMLADANIREEIEGQMALTAEKFELRREHVLHELLEAAYDAKYHGDVSSMISAWREIAALCGFYPTTGRSSGGARG